MAIGIIETFHARVGNAKGVRFEAIRLPREMDRSPPALAVLAGILAPDQAMVDRFTIELARGGWVGGGPKYRPTRPT